MQPRLRIPAHAALDVGIAAAFVLIWFLPFFIEKTAHAVYGQAKISIAHIAANPIIGTDEMASRPLFLAGRRPVPIVALAKPEALPGGVLPAAVPTIHGIVLLGTILAKGHNLALIRNGASAVTALVSQGQAIGPWTVDKITVDHVRLRKGMYVVDLKFSALGDAAIPGQNALLTQRWMPPQLPPGPAGRFSR